MKIVRILETLILAVTGMLVSFAAPASAVPSALVTVSAAAASGSAAADIIMCPIDNVGCRKTQHPGQDV